MGKYRPEGWKNVDEEMLALSKDKPDNDQLFGKEMRRKYTERAVLFEMGADAMLEALRKTGVRIGNKDALEDKVVAAIDTQMMTLISDNGKWVFIPDDDTPTVSK